MRIQYFAIKHLFATLACVVVGLWAQSQINISGQSCASTGGTGYQYLVSGPLQTTDDIQWCVTGGTIVANSGTCLSGIIQVTGPRIVVIWQPGYTSGKVEVIISRLGSATKAINFAGALDGGSIRGNQTVVAGEDAPAPLISLSDATGGDCNASYQYQWELATSSGVFTAINGATSNAYSFTNAILETTTYRRRVTDGIHVAYSNTVTISVAVPPLVISGENCVEPYGTSYAYITSGNWNLDSYLTWEITGGNFTGTQSAVMSGYVRDIGPRIYVTWNLGESTGKVKVTGQFLTGEITSYSSTFNTTVHSGILLVPDFISGDQQVDYLTPPAALVSLTNGSDGNGPCNFNDSKSYAWEKSNSRYGPFEPAGVATPNLVFTAPLDQTTYFRRKVFNFTGVEYSNVVKINVSSPYSENLNYVREHDISIPGLHDWVAIDKLPIGMKAQSTKYLDGLGRPVQTVQREASGAPGTNTWQDIVVTTEYDAAGRQPHQFLAYATNANAAKFKPSAVTDQAQYYLNSMNETVAYGQVVFENSPLGRPLNSKKPGSSWALGAGNSFEYDVNDVPDNVRIWNIGFAAVDIPVTTDVYAPNTLYKNIVADEKGQQTIEYQDKGGRLILKKVQVDPLPSPSYAGWICTYYVYDDFGHLRYVIQPEAVKYLDANGWTFATPNGSKVLEEQCLYYRYDEKGRNVVKKAPGAQELYMVYDNRDRLVFTQDGNQRNLPQPEWHVSLYDEFNRNLLTALYKTIKTRDELVADVNNAIPGNAVITTPSDAVVDLVANQRIGSVSEYKARKSVTLLPNFETRENDEVDIKIDASVSANNGEVKTIYANPVAASDLGDPDKVTLLTYSYYDDYQFPGAKQFINAFNNGQAYPLNDPNIDPIVSSSRTTGMATGGKVRVLGTNTFLATTFFYDEKARPIQVQEENIASGIDITTNQYHFEGRLMSSHISHTAVNTAYAAYSIVKKNTYDKIGRITGTSSKFGDNSFTDISAIEYDDLGRVKTKRLAPGYTGTGKNELETMTYSYNIQSYINGINKDYATKTAGSYDKWGNFFGEYIGYDNAATDAAGNKYFLQGRLDGKIAGIVWSTQGDDAQRKYDYDYDVAGRLSNALYKEKKLVTDGWNNAKTDFTTSGTNGKIVYDLNGNLLSLLRKGTVAGAGIKTVDDLNYSYAAFSNKLLNVADNGNMGIQNGLLGDFKDGTNTSTDDYAYDDNGNLQYDLNKAIDAGAGTGAIKYNFLDKPEEIIVAGKGVLKIVYDAAGNKLRQIFTPSNGNPEKRTTYIGAFVYERNAATAVDELQFILHDEGRLRIITPQNITGTPGLQTGGGIAMPDNKQGVLDFFLKDHLGDVRMVLTEETHREFHAASMEDSDPQRKQYEEGMFGKVNADGSIPTDNELLLSRKDIPSGWTSHYNDPANKKAVKLSSLTGQPAIGPNVILRVMTGDYLHTRADYYFETPAQATGYANLLSDVVTSLAGSIANGPVQGAAKNNLAGISGNLNDPGGSLATFVGQRPTGGSLLPRAAINYLFFDEQFNFIAQGSGYVPVQTAGDGQQLVQSNIRAPQNGYVYVYLSNESQQPVYFDNFSVTHERGRILEEDHYYPYGLKMAGISSRAFGKMENWYLYNGKELIEEGDVDWYDYGARMYDAPIGRWNGIDPRADEYESLSPYNYTLNDPVNYVDPDGQGVNDFFKLADGTIFWSNSTDQITYTDDGQIGVNIGLSYIDGDYLVRGFRGVPNGGVRWLPLHGEYTPEILKEWNQAYFQHDRFKPESERWAMGNGYHLYGDPLHGYIWGANEAIESDGLGPVDYVLGVGLEKIGQKAVEKIGEKILAKEGLEIGEKIGEKAIVSQAAKTSSRAFFSGAGMEARAINEGFTTLSQTRAGQNLMKMTEGMPYYPGSQAYNWWARLSSTYAKGIPKGSNVNVFLNNPSPTGIWNAVEKPILQQRGINIIYK